MLRLQQFFVAKGTPLCSTDCTGVDRIRVTPNLHFQFLLNNLLFHCFDQSFVYGEPARDQHDPLTCLDGLQQFDKPACHGDMNSFKDIGRADSPRNHVDHVSLGKYGADTAYGLGIVGGF